MMCQITCRNKAGEGAHMFRAHRQVAEERHLFDETQCPHCRQEFHTFSRMKMHLRTSDRCFSGLRDRRVVCQIAPGSGSAHDTVARSQRGTLTVQTASGPLPDPEPARHHLQSSGISGHGCSNCHLICPFLGRVSARPSRLSFMSFLLDAEVCGRTADDLDFVICHLTSTTTSMVCRWE